MGMLSASILTPEKLNKRHVFSPSYDRCNMLGIAEYWYNIFTIYRDMQIS